LTITNKSYRKELAIPATIQQHAAPKLHGRSRNYALQGTRLL